MCRAAGRFARARVRLVANPSPGSSDLGPMRPRRPERRGREAQRENQRNKPGNGDTPHGVPDPRSNASLQAAGPTCTSNIDALFLIILQRETPDRTIVFHQRRRSRPIAIPSQGIENTSGGDPATWTLNTRSAERLADLLLRDRDLDPRALLLEQHRHARVACAPAAIHCLRELLQRQVREPHGDRELSTQRRGE